MPTTLPPALDRRIRGGSRSGIEAAVNVGAIYPDKYAYVDAVLTHGGKPFVERLQKYGRTKNNEPLVTRRWFLEVCEALGDFRIGRITSTGCSRSGKSLSNILCSVDQVIAGRQEIGYIYADMASRDANAATEWRPVADYWVQAIEAEIGSNISRREDVKTVKTWQVDGISAHFRYAGTSTTSKEGQVAMGTAATGYSASTLYQDEMSQWAPGLSFKSRLNDSVFNTLPERQIGTPGAGQGIEVYVKKVDRYFSPHYRCTYCNAEKPLDPYGCLLQPKTLIQNGKSVLRYLSQSNRPIDWWYADARTPIESARICCSECGEEILEPARTIDAWMRCTLTGEDLRDYLDKVTDDPSKGRKIALHFSPLCREGKPNIAQLLIEEGLNEERTAADWVQQDLGWPTEPKGDQLTVATLTPLVNADYPRLMEPRWTIAGIDCGRGEHWLWIMQVFPPKNWQRLSVPQVLRQSVRRVTLAAPVIASDIPRLLEEHNVDFGLIDNEPGRSASAQICDRTCLEMSDQKGRHTIDYEKKSVFDGGQEFPCWFINSDHYKQSVVNAAIGVDDLAAWDGKPSYRFPEIWEKYTKTNSEVSPFRHLAAIKFDPLLEKWVRPRDHIDDIFFAAHFAEAGLAIAIDRGYDAGDVAW